MSTELKTIQAPVASAVELGFASNSGLELLQRGAKMLASSNLTPKDFAGNVANCAIALATAHRMGVDPLSLMQSMSIIHGRPTLSAAYLIGCFNNSGRFTAIKYDFIGTKGAPDYGCRAWAIERETGEKVVGPDVTIAMANAEGWSTKNGSKWKTMPDLMLRYRAASFLIRTVAPELSLGMLTQEEARDIREKDITPTPVRNVSGVAGLKARLLAPAPEHESADANHVMDQIDKVIAETEQEMFGSEIADL